MKDFCIVLMFDMKFLQKSRTMIKQIRGVGKYEGDIVCVISNNLRHHINLLYTDSNIIIKCFEQLSVDKIAKHPKKLPEGYTKQELARVCFPMKRKMIHYHKFYIFHIYFRKHYKKCFYIDTGAQIFKPLDKIINLDCTGKLLAHSDAYPLYEDTLTCQFDSVIFPDLYKELKKNFDLDRDHFQATIMLYDTSIIQEDTFDELNRLANLYVNCKTNDQGILNLYFNCILNKWEQIKIKDNDTYYYDFWERGDLTTKDYIMLKYPKTRRA